MLWRVSDFSSCTYSGACPVLKVSFFEYLVLSITCPLLYSWHTHLLRNKRGKSGYVARHSSLFFAASMSAALTVPRAVFFVRARTCGCGTPAAILSAAAIPSARPTSCPRRSRLPFPEECRQPDRLGRLRRQKRRWRSCVLGCFGESGRAGQRDQGSDKIISNAFCVFHVVV